MKLFLNFFSIFSLLFLFVFVATAFAHEAEIPHEESVPAISPVLLVGIVGVLAIGGFIVWKFVLRSPKSTSPSQSSLPDKTPPPQEKTVSQSSKEGVS